VVTHELEVLERNEVLELPAASNENNGPSNGHAKPTDEMASIDGTLYAQPTGAADDPVRFGFASEAPLRPVWDADSRLQVAAEPPAAEQPAEQLAMPARSSPLSSDAAPKPVAKRRSPRHDDSAAAKKTRA